MSAMAASERIVVLTSSYPTHPGDPSGHFVAAEVARLRRCGHDVLVLAPDTRPGAVADEPGVLRLPAGDAFGWPGALPRLRERPLRALGALSFVRAARAALRAAAPRDRFVAHFVVPSVWPILDGLPRPARSLEVVAHGSDVRLLARLPAVLRRRIARCLEPFEVRCVSAELAARLGDALGPELARRARVEPPALELEHAPERLAARRSLGFSPGELLAVVVGRLIREKRVEVALRSARLVPGLRTVVVGDGPERAALAAAFPEVRFVGTTSRPRALEWMAAADVLLVASREEGASSVVREARALGTLVVALASGDLGAAPSGDRGLWVLPRSPSS